MSQRALVSINRRAFIQITALLAALLIAVFAGFPAGDRAYLSADHRSLLSRALLF